MKAIASLIFSALMLSGCTPSQECSSARTCYKPPQTPLSSSVLYDTFKGSVIARSLPMEDRLIAAYNAQHVLKEGQLKHPYEWENPLSSSKGSFELLSLHKEKNTPCFTYKQSIHISDKILIAQGTACQTSYQIWSIIHEVPETDAWFMANPDKGFIPSLELKTRLSRFID